MNIYIRVLHEVGKIKYSRSLVSVSFIAPTIYLYIIKHNTIYLCRITEVLHCMLHDSATVHVEEVINEKET